MKFKQGDIIKFKSDVQRHNYFGLGLIQYIDKYRVNINFSNKQTNREYDYKYSYHLILHTDIFV